MLPRAIGGRFGTMTWKLCWPCKPPGSEAVTVTDALPGATAVTVMAIPEMDTVATPEFEEVAEKVSMSPFSSLKQAVTVACSPAFAVTCGMAPQATGACGFSHAATNATRVDAKTPIPARPPTPALLGFSNIASCFLPVDWCETGPVPASVVGSPSWREAGWLSPATTNSSRLPPQVAGIRPRRDNVSNVSYHRSFV